MTVSTTTNRVDYTGNGSTTVFSFTFRIFADTDLVVTTANDLGVETELVLGDDYTVSGVGSYNGGSITLGTALTNGYAMTIQRVLPFTQETDLRNQGAFYAETHEDVFDRMAMVNQQLQEQIDRSAKLPVTSSEDADALVADIVLLADHVTQIDTVADNISDVTTVANDLNEAVSEINTVATAIVNVNNVGNNIDNVNTVAGISANVTTVAGIQANVTTVAGISGDVTTVAGISADVAAVENIAANVTTVAGIDADVSAVAAVASGVAAVASITSDVSTVAANIVDVQNAEENADAAIAAQAAAEAARDAALAALDSFDDRYLGQKSSDPTLDNDGNALVAGALYFNTVDDVMKVYEGSIWVSAYASLSGALLAANNLSDLTSTSTARTNIGLSTASQAEMQAGTEAALRAMSPSLVKDAITALGFPSGTAMMFAQTAAPTGWTKSTTHNNKALRVVSGTASSGGSVDFTTAFASQTPAGTIGSTTLTESQIPSHTHQAGASVTGGVAAKGGAVSRNTAAAGIATTATGGGGSHNHTFTGTAINLAVAYVDVIIATKD